MKRGIIYSLCLAAVLTGFGFYTPAARADSPSTQAPVPAVASNFTQQISNGPSTIATQFVGGQAMPSQTPQLPDPGEASYIAARLIPATAGTNWQRQRVEAALNIYNKVLDAYLGT